MPSPTIFSYSLVDELNVKASSSLFVSYDAATETVDALLAAAAYYGGLINAITGCRIREFNVIIPALPDPTWKATPDAGSRVEQTLLENWNITDSKYPQAIDIPGLKNSLLSADKKPTISAGAIKAFNDAVIAGYGVGPEVAIQSSFLENLNGLRDAALSFRKHRRAVKAVTTVTP